MPEPATDRRSHGQRTLVSILVCGALLSGCTTRSVAETVPGQAAVTFDRYEVVIGSTRRPAVLTGFLLGGAIADLAVVHIDENDDRRLQIYTFDDGTWTPKLDATLRPDVLFLDVANIGGRDRLVTYGAGRPRSGTSRGRLSWFDPESASERPLVAVTSSFDPPRENEIPHVDITRDVNGDGRDDLVLPDVDGFRVFIQSRDGAFADPVKIGPPTDLGRIEGADGYRYDPWSQSRVHEMDFDRDGRRDLVFWSKDHFEVHLQDQRGLFTSPAKTFTTDVAFESDRLDTLATGDMTGRVLHSLADINGDGVGDLVVYSLEGRSVSGKRSTYEVHLGEASPGGGTAFARDAGITFRSDDRVQVGMDLHDFDRDGRVDLRFTTIDVDDLGSSLWKSLKGLMGDDIVLHLEFFRNSGGVYSDEPDTTHPIALDGAPSHREPGWVPLDIVLRGAVHENRRTQKRWPRAFNRTLLIGDVTGDRRADLLLEAEFNDLHVFVGVPGPDLFARRPRTVAVELHDAEYTWLADLNGDGKQDVLTHHPFTLRNPHGGPKRPPGTEPQRLTLLIAR